MIATVLKAVVAFLRLLHDISLVFVSSDYILQAKVVILCDGQI